MIDVPLLRLFPCPCSPTLTPNLPLRSLLPSSSPEPDFQELDWSLHWQGHNWRRYRVGYAGLESGGVDPRLRERIRGRLCWDVKLFVRKKDLWAEAWKGSCLGRGKVLWVVEELRVWIQTLTPTLHPSRRFPRLHLLHLQSVSSDFCDSASWQHNQKNKSIILGKDLTSQKLLPPPLLLI